MDEVRFCLCGCGEILKNKRRNYINGHAKGILIPPLCACGCGEKVVWDKWKHEWGRYVTTHYAKNRTEAHNKKIGEVLKIRLLGENNPFYGKKHTEETKKKISEANTDSGIWHKHVHPFLGKSHSEEHKRKIGESSLGRKHTEESRNKISLSHLGVKFTNEHKSNLSKSAKKRKGDKNPNWKGGITSLLKRIRKLDKYTEWRKFVFTRDCFTCGSCNKTGGDLNAHHKKAFIQIIKSNKIETIEEAISCKELWDVENGITLCKECHQKEHKI